MTKKYSFAFITANVLQTSSSKTVKYTSLYFSNLHDKTFVTKCQSCSQVSRLCTMTMYCPIKHLLKWDLAKKLPLLEHPLHSSDLDPSLCNVHMNENTLSIIRQFTEIWQWSLNDFQPYLKAWQRHVWNYNISQHSSSKLAFTNDKWQYISIFLT